MIAIDVIKMARVKGDVICKIKAEKDNRIIEMRFMWMPGIRPVIVPKTKPSSKAKINSRAIFLIHQIRKLFIIYDYSFFMDYEHQPHEGASQESSDTTVPDPDMKRDLYEKSLKEIRDRIREVDSLISRMATVIAVLRSNLPYYFWCGFYFAEEKEMVVGPYQGSTACAHIEYKGVCGTSARKKETIIVPDVHKFPGHIACDERSNSEIVVPIIGENDMVVAVLDVDSTQLNAFDEVDKECLENLIVPILLRGD